MKKIFNTFKFNELVIPLSLVSIWTAIIVFSFWYNHGKDIKSRKQLAEIVVKEMVNKDIVYRLWNAGQGGVYVPVTNTTKPNKYLSKVKGRDITTIEGHKFTLMNPAWMSRLAMERYKALYDIDSKITSLNPINPINRADEWEKEKLMLFDLDPKKKDIIDFINDSNGKQTVRYIRPFLTEQSCLKCHKYQGYRIGDIRGAISLSLRMSKFKQADEEVYYTLLFSHFLFWIVGIVGLGIASLVVYRRKKALELNRIRLIKAKLDADRANSAKGQLLASVGHEMRTPLSVIVGISDELSEGATKSNRSHLSTLKRNASVLNELISDLLDMSRINISALKLNLAPLDLNRLVESVIESMEMINTNPHLKIHYTFDSGINLLRVGDELRLRQILLNLTNNALKFTESGFISVKLHGKEEGRGIILEIEDSGIGISPANIESIFKPFEQEASFLTRKNSGVGLGLYITKQLVELMGGTIMLKSEKGVGTCFRICLDLPVAETEITKKHSMEGEKSLIPDRDTLPLNILLVDDSPDIVELVKLFLAGTSHSVTVAINGREAIDLFQKSYFDLILMDIQMPVMDGITATKIIRENEQSKGEFPVEIWALTAHVIEDEVKTILDSGVSRVIKKPVRKRELRVLINDFSSKVQYRRTFKSKQ